ncbi:hypothetical protein O23A_p3763 [Aeromonas salmonicida]|nr:hypothetical protein O23A_p3763 [Aeromonas salmonicida]
MAYDEGRHCNRNQRASRIAAPHTISRQASCALCSSAIFRIMADFSRR